jgi:hypothetical protein
VEAERGRKSKRGKESGESGEGLTLMSFFLGSSDTTDAHSARFATVFALIFSLL